MMGQEEADRMAKVATGATPAKNDRSSSYTETGRKGSKFRLKSKSKKDGSKSDTETDVSDTESMGAPGGGTPKSRRKSKAAKKKKGSADAASASADGAEDNVDIDLALAKLKAPSSFKTGWFGSTPTIDDYGGAHALAVKAVASVRKTVLANAALEAEKSNLEDSKAELTAEIARLKSQAVAHQRNQMSFAEEQGRLRAEKAAFEKAKAELLAKAEKVSAETEAKHKEALDELKTKNAELQSEVTKLTGETAGEAGNLAANLKHKTEALSEAERKIEFLKAQAREDGQAAIAKEKEIRAAEREKAAEKIAALEAKLAELEASGTASAEVLSRNAALEAQLKAKVEALEKAEADKAAADARAEAAGGVNAEAIVSAMAKAFGAGADSSSVSAPSMFGFPAAQKPIVPSIQIMKMSDDFDPSATIQVKRLASKEKITLGGAGASFRSSTDQVVSTDLAPGKFKAGKFTIKVNNGTKASVTLVHGDTLEKVAEKIDAAVESGELPLSVSTQEQDGKYFIVLKANEVGEANHFEIYPEDDEVLQNIDRQVLPGPNKVCIYANALTIKNGVIAPEGFDQTKKWYEYCPDTDFSTSQTLVVNGVEISRNISPDKNPNPAMRSKVQDALRLIGSLIQKSMGEGAKASVKTDADDKLYLEITAKGPIDIDFPGNSMLRGNMVAFGDPDDKAVVAVNSIDCFGYNHFYHEKIGAFTPLTVDSDSWDPVHDPGRMLTGDAVAAPAE